MSTAQQAFDETYITSSEIVKRLRTNRPTISQAPKRGLLPPPIVVNNSNLHIWLRAEAEPMLRAWEAKLNAKRAARA